MRATGFEQRRREIETYFDHTASAAWARLTSDAKLGRIRATVRAGRDRMRATLLGYLPETMDGATLLDAGSGTGALAMRAATRGADVTAIDLSPTLVTLARQRAENDSVGKLRFLVGDMTDATLGAVDHVVAMDSLIHYECADVVRVLAGYAERTHRSILFTFAPRTTLLAIMHAMGRLFPRGNRSPSIVPLAEADLRRRIQGSLPGWRIGRSERIASGFYTSQAMELVRV
jgi:magnesium-protoporphyrin O-methyltransferase